MKKAVIAIDGPAGAGKSTIARMVAQKLGYVYIDTGAMYRAAAWKVLQSGQPITDDAIIRIVRDTKISLASEDGKICVSVDGQDVTAEIRTPAVTALVSRVAQLAPVREKMVLLQRKMAESGEVVMDKGYTHGIEELKAEIAARDKADTERKVSPLVRVPEAVLIDTTEMTIEETVAAVLKLCR